MTDTATQKNKRRLRGTVVSDKMQDTLIVLVEDYVKHPKYGKFIKRQKRYAVDSPKNTCAVGDTVMIQECRPVSKTKRFRIVSESGELKAKTDSATHS